MNKRERSIENVKIDMLNLFYDLLDYAVTTPIDDFQNSALNACIHIKSYIYFLKNKEGTPKTIIDFINKSECYETEEIKFFSEKVSYEILHSSSISLFYNNLDFFSLYLEDILKLIHQVLTQDLADPHYSGITAINRLQDYLNATDNSLSVKDYLSTKGFSKMEIQEIKRRIDGESHRWYGDPEKVANIKIIFEEE